MNFITPLLFVFYFQVMPPPPPPGGSELQSLQILNDLDGSDITPIYYNEGWWPMQQAVESGLCLGGTTQYCDYWSILLGLENGNIKLDTDSEVWFMWQYAPNSNAKERFCRIQNDPTINYSNYDIDWHCQNEGFSVPIPIWSKLLLLVSLICLWSRQYSL